MALILIAILYAMQLVEKSMLPKWFPGHHIRLTPWVIWMILLGVAILRAGCHFFSRHSNHAILELVRARLKFSEAFRLLILERESSLFISRLNTHMTEIIPRAADYVYSAIGLAATMIQTTVLAAGLVFLAWRETIVGLFCLGLAAVIVTALGKKVRRMGAMIPMQHQRLARILVKISRNWLLIRILKLNRREYHHYLNSVYNYFSFSRNTSLLRNAAVAIPPFMGILALAIIILSSLEFFHTHPLKLVAFIYLFIRFTQYLVQITDLYSAMHQFHPQFSESSRLLASMSANERKAAFQPAENLFIFKKIRETIPEIPELFREGINDLDHRTAVPDIKLMNVTFTWPGMPHPIINNFSLSISPGMRFGIIGPNGCGKSTLLGIILGVLSPDTGSVQLGGMEPSQYIASTRAIGYVGEEPFLVEGTVRDNLTYGLEMEISDRELWEILKTVGLDMTILNTGKRLDHHINENGEGLSTGEQQKLSLARAFLRQPKLLVLDEPSSNIDWKSETEIAAILKKWGDTCTILIVSHKPGILTAADEILNLKPDMKPAEPPANARHRKKTSN